MDEEGRRERPWLCTRAHGPLLLEFQPRHDPSTPTLPLRPRLIDSHILDALRYSHCCENQRTAAPDPRLASVKPLKPCRKNGERALSLTGNITTKTGDFQTKPSATPTPVHAAKEMNKLQLICSRMYASTAGGGGEICGAMKIGVVWCRRKYR